MAKPGREKLSSRFGHACNAIAIVIEIVIVIEINDNTQDAHGTHFQFQRRTGRIA
jgi:hypothetical protein